MATIVLDYGPIYGEVVNGTVQGRPNGSVFVPISNTISMVFADTVVGIGNELHGSNNWVILTNASNQKVRFGAVAQSQDLASNLQWVISEDATLTTILGTTNISAGNFNVSTAQYVVQNYTLTPGTTYYVCARLVNNGVPVAVSSVLELVA